MFQNWEPKTEPKKLIPFKAQIETQTFRIWIPTWIETLRAKYSPGYPSRKWPEHGFFGQTSHQSSKKSVSWGKQCYKSSWIQLLAQMVFGVWSEVMSKLPRESHRRCPSWIFQTSRKSSKRKMEKSKLLWMICQKVWNSQIIQKSLKLPTVQKLVSIMALVNCCTCFGAEPPGKLREVKRLHLGKWLQLPRDWS